MSTNDLFNAITQTIMDHEPEMYADVDANAKVLATLSDIVGCLMASLHWRTREEYEYGLDRVMKRIEATAALAFKMKRERDKDTLQ